MDFPLLILMILLGFIGSFFSGLLGIGGAIINYPLLLFIPSLLGIAHFSSQEVSSISMFQVFFASLAGMVAIRQAAGNSPSLINKTLVFHMGGSILLGSLIGGYSSKYLTGEAINFIYGVLAVLAVVLMLLKSKGKEDADEPFTFNPLFAAAIAFGVGIVSGIVGAGGAFILIPIMLTVLKIPTRVTIASSLAIVFLSAIGGVLGKLSAGHIPLLPTLFTIVGSLLGAPYGARTSARINVQVLRYGLVVIISCTAVKIWIDIL